MTGPDLLELPGRTIAYQRQALKGSTDLPGVVFLSGFGSDMTGSKAEHLATVCAQHDQAYLRFDYRGHGQSSGNFIDGCIGDWFADALAVFDQLTAGPQILVGSSMGGWIALLLARARPERIAGLIGIAAAPDFTEDLVRPNLSPRQRQELATNGVTYDYDAPEDFRLPYTQKMLDDGRNHLLLTTPLVLPCPVHLLHGMQDTAVPWQHALKLVNHMTAPQAHLTLIKDGEHRLSRTEDLELLADLIADFNLHS
ncbi:MAG: alpha/beta hydrolase, partial [Proteobacteria bacterium]|nr:alpha/beta hydrolase [Pseudomonadota bacterium]